LDPEFCNQHTIDTSSRMPYGVLADPSKMISQVPYLHNTTL
jgi:hypothetical protein